jgi:hypothetical protein
MRLPKRYQPLAARCDPLLEQMGMPPAQREAYLAELIGLIGQILDQYFRELSQAPDAAETTSRNPP